ncbi:hypothetical protein [Shouchella shacheensis]|nr:hypothetical protein [Shouchella shacheensis]
MKKFVKITQSLVFVSVLALSVVSFGAASDAENPASVQSHPNHGL